MKIITLVLLILLSNNIYSQKSIFVRVYDLAGKKVNKGHVLNITDTSLQLEGKSPVDIPVDSIGSIKTKHSAGNNLLIGSIIGASSVAIIGAVTAEPEGAIVEYTAAEGAAAGALIGIPVGAAIGGLTILFKNSKTFLINGDVMKWKAFELWITEKNNLVK